MIAPHGATVVWVSVAAVALLAGLGALGARLGGAPPLKATLRVTTFGVLALAASAAVGALFGVAA